MRQLKESDLKVLYNLLRAKYDSNNDKYSNFIQFANRYYKGAATATIVVNSEYNDNTYDNTVGYVEVCDANGNLLKPIEGKREEARTAMKNLSLSDYETDDVIDDITIYLTTQPIPILYMED